MYNVSLATLGCTIINVPNALIISVCFCALNTEFENVVLGEALYPYIITYWEMC